MKILVLNLSNLEKTILSLPLLNSLRKTFPKNQIDFVTFNENLKIIEKHKSISQFYSIEKNEKKFEYFLKVLKILRNKYDIIIDLTSDEKSGLFTLFSLRTKYKIRKDRGKIFNYGANYLIPEEKKYLDEIEKNLKFLEPLEKEFKINYVKNIELETTEDEKEKIKKRMSEEGINTAVPIIACSFNFNEENSLNEKEVMEIIKKLSSDRYFIVICYADENQEKIKNIYKGVNKKEVCIFKINEKSEYKSFFESCKFWLGNDYEVGYIAQGMDIPEFTIFENREKWIFNFNKKFQGIVKSRIVEDYEGFTENKSFASFSVANIVEKVEKMLKENKIL